MDTFLIEYRHGGERYSFEIYANDWADAEARLNSIALSGHVIGGPGIITIKVAPNWVGSLWLRLRALWVK